MRLVDDIRAGWHAPARPMLSGALIALVISVPVALVLGILTPLDEAIVGLVVLGVQLAAGYAIAGRLARGRD